MKMRMALAALALAAAPAPAQESGAYVVRLGRDTVLVERFTRTGDRVEGTIVGRSPRTAVRSYTATLRPDGGIRRLRVVTRIPAAPELLPQTLTVTLGVPAGSYTLWTVPGPEEWTLIINRQTGQWGTVYDPGRDLTHIPVRPGQLGDTEEVLTTRFQPATGEGRLLAIPWENTRLLIPVRVAP